MIDSGAAIRTSANANLGGNSAMLVLNGGSLENTASFTTGRNIDLAGTGTFNTDAGTTLTDTAGTVSGAGSLVKNSAGTRVLGGTAAQSGGVVVNAGTLVLGGSNSYTGSTTLNGGVLMVSADANLGAAASALNLNGGTLETTASTGTNRSMNVGASGTLDETIGFAYGQVALDDVWSMDWPAWAAREPKRIAPTPPRRTPCSRVSEGSATRW